MYVFDYIHMGKVMTWYMIWEIKPFKILSMGEYNKA